MSQIKTSFVPDSNNWINIQLKDAGSIQTGSTPKTSQKENFGDFIPFITPANFLLNGELKYSDKGLSQIGIKESRLVKAGSVLMVCIGATIGKVGFNDIDVTTNQQINTITPYSGFNAKFIYYQMATPSFQESVIGHSSQATLPIINKSKWSNLSISAPPSPRTKTHSIHSR